VTSRIGNRIRLGGRKSLEASGSFSRKLRTPVKPVCLVTVVASPHNELSSLFFEHALEDDTCPAWLTKGREKPSIGLCSGYWRALHPKYILQGRKSGFDFDGRLETILQAGSLIKAHPCKRSVLASLMDSTRDQGSILLQSRKTSGKE
jgi:hypothetical protein